MRLERDPRIHSRIPPLSARQQEQSRRATRKSSERMRDISQADAAWRSTHLKLSHDHRLRRACAHPASEACRPDSSRAA